MTCPICARDSDPKLHPFCSARCRDVDLGRWLRGSYSIPAEAVEEDSPPDPEAGDKRPQ